jgi:hypothetical protein
VPITGPSFAVYRLGPGVMFWLGWSNFQPEGVVFDDEIRSDRSCG